MTTTEDLFFKIPNGIGPDEDRFVLVRSQDVFEMVEEVRTDFGHSMADGLDITSRPIVSLFPFLGNYSQLIYFKCFFALGLGSTPPSTRLFIVINLDNSGRRRAVGFATKYLRCKYHLGRKWHPSLL